MFSSQAVQAHRSPSDSLKDTCNGSDHLCISPGMGMHSDSFPKKKKERNMINVAYSQWHNSCIYTAVLCSAETTEEWMKFFF